MDTRWTGLWMTLGMAAGGTAQQRKGCTPAVDERSSEQRGTADDPVARSVPDARPGSSEGVELRRSARRRKTVSAYREGDKTVVLVPAGLSPATEERWVATMLARLAAQERRRAPSDADLLVRAQRLCTRYLDGRAEPAGVRWVDNQQRRWGSCTPAQRTIRLSARLRGMPDWVVDYVLLHELAHLLVPGHGPDFWALVGRYPRMERARGFLEGVSAAAGLDVGDAAGTADCDNPTGASEGGT